MASSWTRATETMKEVEEAEHMYQDQEPSFANAAAGIYGCEHYERSCKQQCTTCNRMFACHKCHDNEVKSHSMDRYVVSNLSCMRCGVEQGVSAHCTSPECVSENDFAVNHCLKCRVFTHRPVFHCADCDVCRLGAAEDFVHCDKCASCIQKDGFAAHPCVEGSHESNCPICHESMRSRECAGSVVVTICGHPLHEACLEQLVAHGSFRCPVCLHILGDMSAQFSQLAALVASQPMPEEYALARATIECLCCHTKASVPFHWVGHACPSCGSFNSAILATSGLPDAPLLNLPIHDNVDIDIDGQCDMSLDSEE